MARQRRFPALALLLIVAVLPLACGGKKKNANNNAAAPVTPARAATTPTPAPADLLTTATTNTQSLKAFHFTLTHQNGATMIVQGISMTKADGDFVNPDRFKADVDGTVAGGITIHVKAISIGDSVWLALIDDRFQPLPNGVGASAILDPNNGVLKALKGVKSPAYAGSDRIGNTDTTIITGTIDAGDLTALDNTAQAGKSVPGRVWIGVADNLVYRLRLEGPLNDQEPGNIVRQIDLSQFNENVNIQPPQ